jgi:SOS-response transcriptional repressor LexA
MENYSEYLSKSIEHSTFTLSQISEKLREKGFSTDRTYLSKLKNGKIAPAGEEINNALAEILEIDPDKLLILAFLEKAPSILKGLFYQFDNLNQMIDLSLDKIFDKDFELSHIFSKEEIDSFINKGFHPYEKSTFRGEIKNRLSIKDKWKFFNQLSALIIEVQNKNSYLFTQSLFNDIVENQFKFSDAFSNESEENSVINQFPNRQLIPILRSVYSGGSYNPKLHLKDLISINKDLIDENDGMFILDVIDDSMAGDGIHKGDEVLVKSQKSVKETDIAVVTIKDQPGILCRIQHFNDSVLLRPSNTEHIIKIYLKNQVSILGKVIEIRHKLS